MKTLTILAATLLFTACGGPRLSVDKSVANSINSPNVLITDPALYATEDAIKSFKSMSVTGSSELSTCSPLDSPSNSVEYECQGRSQILLDRQATWVLVSCRYSFVAVGNGKYQLTRDDCTM